MSVHDLARTIIVADSHASGSPAESGAAFLVAVNTQALLQPLAQGGSAVIVTGTGGMDDEQRHRRLCDIASSERVWIDPDQEASPPR